MTEKRKIDVVAQAIYNAHWKELPDRRFPPVWENVSDKVREFVRIQAEAAIAAVERINLAAGSEP